MSKVGKSLPAYALGPFVYHSCAAPYTINSDPMERLGDELRVVPVRSKTGLAAARRTMLVHRVTGVAAFTHAQKVHYAARWLCGNGTADAVLIADADSHGGLCRRCAGAEQRGPVVYRLYGEAGDLLYVGSTVDVFLRFQGHAGNSPWWPEVVEKQIERFADETAARSAEAAAIRTEHPKYNKLLRRAPEAAKPGRAS